MELKEQRNIPTIIIINGQEEAHQHVLILICKAFLKYPPYTYSQITLCNLLAQNVFTL